MAQAVEGLGEGVAQQVRQELSSELIGLVRGVINAASYEAAEEALVKLRVHPQGGKTGRILNLQLDHILVHVVSYYRGIQRVGPEWCWRDFRLRLSRGRNHGSDQRLGRAALVWAVYRNFTPAQRRSERKRRYRHPGQSPLRWQECHQDRSVIWMLWVYEGSQACCPLPNGTRFTRAAGAGMSLRHKTL